MSITPADEAQFSPDYRLLAGQVITIEPGVYVPEDKRYPKEFRGLGIRIEVSFCIICASASIIERGNVG